MKKSVVQWMPLFSLVIVFVISETVEARPEYAVRTKVNCSSCHWFPGGGGPRTVFGKTFGSRGLDLAKTSSHDWFYGDLRGVYYNPEKPTQRPNGLALMKASASVNVAVLEKESKKTKVIFSRDFSPMASLSETREAFVMWETGHTNSFKPEQVIFGRFYLPFGFLTDEHRTYTRIQTHTTFRDFNMGVMISGNPLTTLHYDLAVTQSNSKGSDNGFNTGDETAKLTANFRFNPSTAPLLLGLSGMYQSTQTNKPRPWALSFYNVIAFESFSNKIPKVSLGSEVVVADNYNRTEFNGLLAGYFEEESTPSVYSETKDSQSLGVLAELKWELNDRLILMYKFDQLALDHKYPGDRFMRHGVGFRYLIDANTSLMVRGEKADVKRSDIDESTIRGGLDAYIAQLRFWL